MKNLLAILFSFHMCCHINAQSLNYKKIMAEREASGVDVFLAQLKAYQKENTQFSNVYYQMGKIELQTFSSLDPIVERVASRQYIYNAKTNFALAKNYTDEKELSKNPEWYDAPDLKEKDSVRVLALKSIDDNYQGTIDYAEYYEKLILNYDKAVSHYLNAQQDFIGINTSADNLRQLFLEADDSLKQAVKQVGVSFDSSMYHLAIYRDTYQLLPHFVKRKVNINLLHIDHFRMNGITPTNFLTDNVDVWNYREWTDRFLSLIEKEVDGLQEEIKTAFKFFDVTNDRMMNGDECLQANIDDLKFQRIINLVTKYDNQSVLIDIFQYLMAKLNYGNQLVYEKNCNVFDSSPTDDYLSRKGRIYRNLFDAFLVADSLDEAIISSGHGEESFQWFFDEMMSKEGGSASFAENQRNENQDSFKAELKKLTIVKEQQLFQTDSISQCYASEEAMLLFEIGGKTEENLCVFKRLDLSDSLHILIAKHGEENLIIGGLPNADDYQKKWEIPTYKNSDVNYFKIVSDSSFVVGGYDKTAWVKNVKMNGAESKEVVLRSVDTLVNVTFNDLQGELTILQKGENYTLSKANFSGKITSSQKIELPGKFISMIRQDQGTWFFSQTDQDGKSVINATIFADGSAEITSQHSYALSSQVSNPFIVKNDNESMTLIATNMNANEEIIYALLNYQAEIQYEQIF